MLSAVETIQVFSGIMVICPCCGELLRVSELSFRFTGDFETTILDDLRQRAHQLATRQSALNDDLKQFEADERPLRAAARKRGQDRFRQVIRAIDPVTSKLDYHPGDIKVISHPVDLVVFDGLNGGDGFIKNIIFIARSNADSTHDVRRSLVDALNSGRFVWETIRVGLDGSVSVRP